MGEGRGEGNPKNKKAPTSVEAFLQPKIIFYILAVNGQSPVYLQHGNRSVLQ